MTTRMEKFQVLYLAAGMAAWQAGRAKNGSAIVGFGISRFHG
jgi:hypothetical protein